MANCIIAQPLWLTQTDPRIATVRAWGGFWEPDLSVQNLLSDVSGAVARSLDCALTSTQVWFDLGTTRGVRIAAIPKSNTTTSAKIRLRGFGVADTTAPSVCDTGWVNYFTDTYPLGSVDWGHPSIFSTTIDTETALLFPQPWVYVFPSEQNARYWLLEIDDTSNPAGYIELSRFILAPGYQPTENFQYQASIKIVDPSEVQRSYGGRVFGEKRQKYRIAMFRLENVSTSEAFVNIHDMSARQGVTGEVFFVWDPQDNANISRFSFLGRLAELNALEAAYNDAWGCNYQIEERVG